MCYTVPLVASFATTVLWQRKKEPKLWSLNLMLYGAALFGVIDHFWNKELFLISDNLLSDLCLGFVITAGVFLVWFGIVVLPKTKTKKIT